MNIGEENKILDKTKFSDWLSEQGDKSDFDVPTKEIEAELRKLIKETAKQIFKELEKYCWIKASHGGLRSFLP